MLNIFVLLVSLLPLGALIRERYFWSNKHYKNVIGLFKLTLILKLADLSNGHPVLSLVLVDELVDW